MSQPRQLAAIMVLVLLLGCIGGDKDGFPPIFLDPEVELSIIQNGLHRIDVVLEVDSNLGAQFAHQIRNGRLSLTHSGDVKFEIFGERNQQWSDLPLYRIDRDGSKFGSYRGVNGNNAIQINHFCADHTYLDMVYPEPVGGKDNNFDSGERLRISVSGSVLSTFNSESQQFDYFEQIELIVP